MHQRESGGIAVEPLLQIDRAAVSECEDRFARLSIECAQLMIAREKQPPFGAVLALPVVDTAMRHDSRSGIGRIGPDFLAGRGIERDDGVAFRKNVHHVIDNERIEIILCVVADRVCPSHFQLANVGTVDLL